MNEHKLKQILETVRTTPPPPVPADFDARVMRRVLREPTPTAPTFAEHLDALFPKLAVAALAMIVLCVAGDYLLTALDVPTLAEGVARLSGQWLLPTEIL